MYLASSLAFQTQNGKWVFPSDREVDRIVQENRIAARSMNPARDAWTYWDRFNAKQAASKAPKKVSKISDSEALIRLALGKDKRTNGGKVDWVAIRDIAIAELSGGVK